MGCAGQEEAGWKGQLWAWVAPQLGQGLWECAHVWGRPAYLQCSDALHP